MVEPRYLSEEERDVYRRRVRELREQLKTIGKPVPPPSETEVCDRCGGSGWINRGSEVCPECDSTVRHYEPSEEPF